MRSIRETYDLPSKPPATFRFVAFMVAFAVGAPLLWLALPHGVVTVAALAIALLLIIAVALRSILSSREVQQPPQRRPVPTRPD
jgi:membrane protein implicated in regulation of membrane protease activity